MSFRVFPSLEDLRSHASPDSVKAPGAPVKSGHFIARGSVALLSGRQNFLNRSLFEV
jgi:hypothetical protein